VVAVSAMTIAYVCACRQRSHVGTLPVFECTPVTSRRPVLHQSCSRAMFVTLALFIVNKSLNSLRNSGRGQEQGAVRVRLFCCNIVAQAPPTC
jgi:hypothetical protein